MSQMIQLSSSAREELIEITAQVQAAVEGAALQNGLCCLYCRHTTAGLLVNENADPDVRRDILLALGHIVPDRLPYRHGEGNSPAHVKAVLCGSGLQLPVAKGKLELGRWQGIYFAEFDGPRPRREVAVTLVPLAGP